MNELAKIGKKRTILISISILLVSIYSIYTYSLGSDGIETNRLVKQLIRFSLTAGLLVMIYKGKRWAKITAIVLFSLAIVGVLFAFNSVFYKDPLFVMNFVYAMAIYHFGFSKSFKAFFEYQNSNIQET